MTSCTEGGSPPAETGDLCSSSDNAKALFAAEHARSRLHLGHHALADPLMHRGSDCALAPARARTKQAASSDHRPPTSAASTTSLARPPFTRQLWVGTLFAGSSCLQCHASDASMAWQFHPSAMHTRAWCQLPAVHHRTLQDRQQPLSKRRPSSRLSIGDKSNSRTRTLVITLLPASPALFLDLWNDFVRRCHNQSSIFHEWDDPVFPTCCFQLGE